MRRYLSTRIQSAETVQEKNRHSYLTLRFIEEQSPHLTIRKDFKNSYGYGIKLIRRKKTNYLPLIDVNSEEHDSEKKKSYQAPSLSLRNKSFEKIGHLSMRSYNERILTQEKKSIIRFNFIRKTSQRGHLANNKSSSSFSLHSLETKKLRIGSQMEKKERKLQIIPCHSKQERIQERSYDILKKRSFQFKKREPREYITNFITRKKHKEDDNFVNQVSPWFWGESAQERSF